MAVFTYIGDEGETTAFGLRFPRDVPVQVTDQHAIHKLNNNRFFAQSFDGVEVLDAVLPSGAAERREAPSGAAKRRGRPPKAK